VVMRENRLYRSEQEKVTVEEPSELLIKEYLGIGFLTRLLYDMSSPGPIPSDPRMSDFRQRTGERDPGSSSNRWMVGAKSPATN
jgi:hypothetical protein